MKNEIVKVTQNREETYRKIEINVPFYEIKLRVFVPFNDSVEQMLM